MIHDFLNGLPNLPLALGIILISALASVGIVLLVRRLVDQKTLKAHSDLIGNIYQMAGVVYAVMLAFAIFIVWEQFDSTQTSVEREANALVSLFDLARALPETPGDALKNDLANYARAVAHEEWGQMALGRSSTASAQALGQLTRFEREFYPANDREAVVYDQSVEHIEELNTHRRLRLLASRGQIPPPMWVLLLSGAVFMVSFTAMFASESLRLHLILTALLGAGLGFTLFIILALDTPYTGSFRITQDPFMSALTIFESNP